MTYRVLVTEPIVESALKKLRRHCEVDIGERGQYDQPAKLARDIPGYDALLSMLSNPVDRSVIAAGKDLKIIANYAVGYDNIDTQAAREADIKVSNTPGVLTEASADIAFSLLLAAGRHICEAQAYVREGNFDGWDPLGFLGLELNGKTLGILGMGRIGQAVARRAGGFGMKVLYHNRRRVGSATETALNASYAESIEQLAREADVLSLNCPLTKETHHIVDAEILNMMKPHALLINTARGPVVDEAALADALHEGRLGGAGLDVFEEEPQLHPRLLTAPNCVVLPHIGSGTHETREAMGELAVSSIVGVLKGKKSGEISNLVVT